jgi:excinuclease ABC subunit C
MAFVHEINLPGKKTPELIGAAAIRAALKDIPGSPGVYRMIGAENNLLYVGKAKNLKNRVTSYAVGSNLNARTVRMIEQVEKVEIMTTGSEAEALLVEASLVKKYKPRYNILLKDDKSFPHLFISSDHPYPRIAKHRGVHAQKGEYFGPFASVGALNETLAILQRIFLLRPCEDTVFKGRTRPCLQYQIKRCSAPCVGYVSQEEYGEQLAKARDFLKGKHRDVQDALLAEMQRASEAQDYEVAAFLRDRIQALTRIQQEQSLHPQGLRDADVIVLVRKGARSVVQLYLFREGAPYGHQSFHPTHAADTPDAEILAGFMGQFYQGHLPAPEILVSIEPHECGLLEEALKIQAGYALEIRKPERGDKRALVENALKLARATLDREELQRASVLQNLEKLKGLFGLKAAPQKIEVYDNSHISGQHALGAMIVATPDGFDKKCYRKFNMKDAAIVPGDDYAMMREMFRRRFKRAAKDEGWAPPDLVLIDGGKGQLSAVTEVMTELGLLEIPLVGVAKGPHHGRDGREWFFMNGREPFQLPENDSTLHYLQRLRDEAHRFAIGAHRNKRSKALTVSALDDIPSIGALRKKALLHHFGSRAAVEGATLAELQNVQGISKSIAQKIYDYFHG